MGLLTLFVVSIIIFTAVNMLPGDFAQAILGQSATPEAVAAIRRDLGLDQPPITRYLLDIIRARLQQRWAVQGFSEEQATYWIELNDIPNAERVIKNRVPEDVLLQASS